MMFTRACLFVVSVAAASPLAASEASPAANEVDTRCQPITEGGASLQLAVLHGEDAAGRRHLDAILSAHEALAPDADLWTCPYMDEEVGTTLLRRLVQSGRYDVVLGPTDSGIFAGAAADRDSFRDAGVPVVSGLVTAPIANRHDGWLFRLNVGIGQRAGALYDHISASGVDSVVVIYADTDFARGAETAFANEISTDPSTTYQAFRIQADGDLRNARRTLETERPAAVGIFSSRDAIERIRSGITSIQSGWNGYVPLLFSIVDTRTTQVQDIHFLSLAGPGEDLEVDEVYGLGYDSADLVFSILDPPNADRQQWRREFRRRLASRLQRSTTPGRMTGMQFEGRENRAAPSIYTLTDHAVVSAPLYRPAPGALAFIASWTDKVDIRIRQWFDILQRRYGFAPWIALLVVGVLAAVLSIADLRSWHGGQSRTVRLQPAFLFFVGFNVLTALVLFSFLAVTDVFGWDSLAGAFMVGLGYPALLKSTLFRSSAGESYGLEVWYDRIVGWIHDRIMLAKYNREIASIKFIAYTNSTETLIKQLEGIYRFARTPQRSEELSRELRQNVQERVHDMDKRIYLAQELKSWWKWKQLDAKRYVPKDVSERQMIDPDRIVRHCASWYMERYPETAVKQAREAVEAKLQTVRAESETKACEAETSIQGELELTHTQLQRLEVYLRWLFVQSGFRMAPISQTEFAPDDLSWDSLRASVGEKLWAWAARKARELRALVPRRKSEAS